MLQAANVRHQWHTQACEPKHGLESRYFTVHHLLCFTYLKGAGQVIRNNVVLLSAVVVWAAWLEPDQRRRGAVDLHALQVCASSVPEFQNRLSLL